MLNKNTTEKLHELIKLSSTYFPTKKIQLFVYPDFISTAYIAIPIKTGIDEPTQITFNDSKLHTLKGTIRKRFKLEIIGFSHFDRQISFSALSKNPNNFINEKGVIVTGERYLTNDRQVNIRLSENVKKIDSSFKVAHIE